MDYISAKQAAALWGIDASRIGKFAREGRIEGAKIVGRNWLIPKNAKKPTDGRTRKGKAQAITTDFRFPFLMDQPEDSYSPPLSAEEAQLRSAELLFLACNFERAEQVFDKLWQSSQDIYVRITAVFFLCYLSAVWRNGRDFEHYYNLLCLAFSEDFAYKNEMELLRPFLLCLLGLYGNAAELFRYDVSYAYSPSAFPVMTFLSFFNETTIKVPEAVDGILYPGDIASRLFEYGGHYYEAQVFHMFLSMQYCTKLNEKAMQYHLKKLVGIAYERNFIYPVTDIYMYYSAEINRVLQEYPEDFAENIRRCGEKVHKSFATFTEQNGITTLYTLLTDKDYQYIRFAVMGYSGRKIAETLHISPRTVATHYARICEKLGINGKRELAAFFLESMYKKQKEQ